VIRSTRWAISPLDCAVHLLAPGDDPPSVVEARCGHLLPTVVHQLDQPPPGPPCEDCRLIFLADCALHAAAGQLAGALQCAPDPGRPPVEPAPVMLPAAGRSQKHQGVPGATKTGVTADLQSGSSCRRSLSCSAVQAVPGA
jgi:hypothetical protein